MVDMQAIRYLRRSERRTLVVSLLLILLCLAAINVPYAVTKIRSRTGAWPVVSSDVRGPAAAVLGWPSSVPHDRPWSKPSYHITHKAFGFREYDVRADPTNEGVNGFSMSVQKLGWPLPVIEIKQMWWDWDDPSLKGPEPDPRPSLVPLGLVANPVLVGLPVWLLLVVAPLMLILTRRVYRARGGDCAWCGYAEVGDGVCPECGPQVPPGV